jgi:NADH dehydrogenase [ubiquinone] 1 alpha subcomplex assembly factor 1
MPSHNTQHCSGVAMLVFGIVLQAHLAFAQAGTPDNRSLQTEGARAKELIEEAISLGVPLYNSGQHNACAAVYRITLRSLLLFDPVSVNAQTIENALRVSSEQAPAQGAWTLRYALDKIYSTTPKSSPVNNNRFPIDFSDANTALWYTTNDNVMGGLSQGRYLMTASGTGQFTGQLSLRNNGGFSSVRTRIENSALAGYDGLEIRLRGDGRVYSLLAAPANTRGSWQKEFQAPLEWETIRVPFETMELSVRGWRPKSYPPIIGDEIQTIGFLISDKDERPFRLEIDWIRSYVDGNSSKK